MLVHRADFQQSQILDRADLYQIQFSWVIAFEPAIPLEKTRSKIRELYLALDLEPSSAAW